MSEVVPVNPRLQRAVRWCAVNHAPKPPSGKSAVYVSERKRRDPAFKALLSARRELNGILRGLMKSNRKLDLIGCSPAELKKLIEGMFEPGMTWKNWGTVWELDHIIPCRMFIFNRVTDIWTCFHFDNFQPLLKWKNRAKGCQVIDSARARKAFL